MYKLSPLSFQVVDWDAFIRLTEEALGDSPTRGLDKSGISTDKPQAFLRSLGLNNDINNLQGMQHCFCGFIGTANADMLLEIAQHTSLALISKESSHRGVFLFVLSGDLDTWKNGLVTLSQVGSKDVRILCNECYSYFIQSGLGIIWDKHKKHKKDNLIFIEG